MYKITEMKTKMNREEPENSIIDKNNRLTAFGEKLYKQTKKELYNPELEEWIECGK